MARQDKHEYTERRNDPNELPMRLKNALERKKMSQRELAKELGVTFQAVSTWVTGGGRPELKYLISIAGILGESTDWLLGIRDRDVYGGDLNMLIHEATGLDSASIDVLRENASLASFLDEHQKKRKALEEIIYSSSDDIEKGEAQKEIVNLCREYTERVANKTKPGIAFKIIAAINAILHYENLPDFAEKLMSYISDDCAKIPVVREITSENGTKKECEWVSVDDYIYPDKPFEESDFSSFNGRVVGQQNLMLSEALREVTLNAVTGEIRKIRDSVVQKKGDNDDQ